MGMLKFKEHRLLASCSNEAPDPAVTGVSVVPTVNVADADTGGSSSFTSAYCSSDRLDSKASHIQRRRKSW